MLLKVFQLSCIHTLQSTAKPQFSLASCRVRMKMTLSKLIVTILPDTAGKFPSEVQHLSWGEEKALRVIWAVCKQLPFMSTKRCKLEYQRHLFVFNSMLKATFSKSNQVVYKIDFIFVSLSDLHVFFSICVHLC